MSAQGPPPPRSPLPGQQPAYPPAAGPPTPEPAPAPAPWMPPNASSTPNAERYLLEADALRRRQLRSALLHGSSRTWRDNRRIWPGIIAGMVVVAVILATFAVTKAVVKYQQDQEEEERRQQQQYGAAMMRSIG